MSVRPESGETTTLYAIRCRPLFPAGGLLEWMYVVTNGAPATNCLLKSFVVRVAVQLSNCIKLTSKQDERIQAAFLLYQLYASHSVGVNPFKSAFEEVLRSEKAKEQNDNEPAPNSMVATLEVILNGKGAQVRP